MRRPAAALSALLLLAAAPALGAGLRVGTCLRDITPVSAPLAAAYEAAFGGTAVVNHSQPIFMAGFGNDRQATGYHDRLWARGVVIESGATRIGIVTLDVVGYFVNEVDTIRSLVSPGSQIDLLVVSSTHNHEGPDTMGLWGEEVDSTGIDFGYLDFVNAAVADCVDEAAAALVPARVRWATGTSKGLSIGADAEDDGYGVGDGKVLVDDELLAPATGGRIVDPRLSTAQFTARTAPYPVLATLVNFASHPESIGASNTLLTSDFPHFARQRLESEYGGLAIWVSGALGVLQGPLDIDVRDPMTGAPAPRRSFRWLEVHGTQLAERVIRALAKAPAAGQSGPAISFARQAPVALPLENDFFRLLAAFEVINSRRTLFTNGLPDTSVGPFPPPYQSFPAEGALGEDVHTEVSAFRVGQGSFAVVPGELDPQLGERFRARMTGAKHTFLIGLGNDEIGYIVPNEKFDTSCQQCALLDVAGLGGLCPVQPYDCSTVFQNNVGPETEPTLSGALNTLLDALH
jgi:hypothetical protein